MSTKLNPDFINVVNHFIFDGQFQEAQPYGCGHINDTYAAYFKKNNGQLHRYIIQRINQQVFKNPEALMQNITEVTQHLRRKIITAGGDPNRETLNLIPTADGRSFHHSETGEYWRAYLFIEDAQTYQVVKDARHFYNAAKAIGQFQQLLSDLPASKLYETIPDFHHTRKRFEALLAAVGQDPVNRARQVDAEIEFVTKRAAEACSLLELADQGFLPIRITHNDTKFNNVMIDNQTGAGICLIDLDTVMPGLALYDYGDSIRFGANPAAEDEPDLDRVYLKLELFAEFTRGYLETAKHFLTPAEVEYLPHAAKIMTLECGIRFLTDHLNGDTYFKIHRVGHNLDRARTQFKLVADMEKKFDRMQHIVGQYR